MRRLAYALLVAVLSLGGCVDALLGIECEDQCVDGERTCDYGDEVLTCSVNLLISSCTDWYFDEDCGDRGAVCSDGYCVCPAGLTDCGICVDTAVDPANCGGCSIPCTGSCVGGYCNQ